MHFLAKNKKLVLSVALNVVLAAALLILLYLVYPQFLYRLDSVENFGGYSIRTYRNDRGTKAYFEVLRRSEEWDGLPHVPRRVYSGSGEVAFAVESFGADVTGKGMPDLVIQQWCGSASGQGSTYFVLEPDGSTVKKIAAIQGLAGIKCEDADQDGIKELVGCDETYCFFGGFSRAGSPLPSVVLSFDPAQGRFVVNKRLMAKPPLPEEQLKQLSLKYRDDPWWTEGSHPPEGLFGTIFDLIYTGNEKQAWELLDASWPHGCKFSKEEWKRDVEDALRSSPYSPLGVDSNGGKS